MIRLASLLLALIPLLAAAQEYKPLEAVEVPDTWGNIINVQESEGVFSKHIRASHRFATRSIGVRLSAPPHYDLSLIIEGSPVQVDDYAKMEIGGSLYYLQVGYVNEGSTYIYMDAEHVKHIAVSGLQSITFLRNGDEVLSIAFNTIEQEMWRRTAEDLKRNVYLLQ